MIQRFHDQFLQKMSPERRARKLSVVKALTRGSVRQRNKENQDPLNNNLTLVPCSLKHSTPLKQQVIAVTDEMTSEFDTEIGINKNEDCLEQDNEINEGIFVHSPEPQLIIAKIVDLTPNIDDGGLSQKSDLEADVRVPETVENNEEVYVEEIKAEWRSLEVPKDTSEYDFYRTLEASKLFVSSSSLLEEIEADLPSSYSLLRPFNHTFHTLTSYRTITRLARMDSNVTCPVILDQKKDLEVQNQSQKREYLEVEATVQKTCAAQAEKALNFSKIQNPMGVEHLESEKSLLLANLRYNAAIRELRKLKVFGGTSKEDNFAQITITDMFFTLDDSLESPFGYFLCTATEGERVKSSSILAKPTDKKLHFNDTFKFQNLGRDFVIYIELYRLCSKEPKTISLLRKLKKIANRRNFSLSKSIISSIDDIGFSCVACAELRLSQIVERENEKCIVHFIQTPLHPVIGTTITLLLNTDVNVKSHQKGFLNVFQQTWHRRWYLQSGYFLESWFYPEDHESEKPPVNSIYLGKCTSPARIAGLDICVRPYSFIINLEPNECVLFSAGSHEEMMTWIDHLNLVIEYINLWKPAI